MPSKKENKNNNGEKNEESTSWIVEKRERLTTKYGQRR